MVESFIAVVGIAVLVAVIWDIFFSTWRRERHGKVTCSVCGKKIMWRDAHEIVHGIDSMSDGWSDYYCQKCRVPDVSCRITAHNVR